MAATVSSAPKMTAARAKDRLRWERTMAASPTALSSSKFERSVT